MFERAQEDAWRGSGSGFGVFRSRTVGASPAGWAEDGTRRAPRQACSGTTILPRSWIGDPFARGAYSYMLVCGAESPAKMARPVANALFFAGEACDAEGRNGTVHGAIGSGRRAAREVARTLTR